MIRLDNITERGKNTMFEKVKEFAQRQRTKLKLAAGTGAAGIAGVVTAVAASAEDAANATYEIPMISSTVTADMITPIVQQITSLVPVLLPAVIGVLAFRKGLSFFIGMIRGL